MNDDIKVTVIALPHDNNDVDEELLALLSHAIHDVAQSACLVTCTVLMVPQKKDEALNMVHSRFDEFTKANPLNLHDARNWFRLFTLWIRDTIQDEYMPKEDSK